MAIYVDEAEMTKALSLMAEALGEIRLTLRQIETRQQDLFVTCEKTRLTTDSLINMVQRLPEQLIKNNLANPLENDWWV